MTPGTDAVREFVRQYRVAEFHWQELDRPIIQYFADNPHHDDVNKVYAKVALVNRVYRANIQMGMGNAEWSLATALITEDVDSWLRPVREANLYCREFLPSLLEAHGNLVYTCKKVTGKAALSFASKYLSFCNPAVVPILDSKAESSVRQIFGKRRPGKQHRGYLNTRYAVFCEYILLLVEELARSDNPIDMKKVDAILYGGGD